MVINMESMLLKQQTPNMARCNGKLSLVIYIEKDLIASKCESDKSNLLVESYATFEQWGCANRKKNRELNTVRRRRKVRERSVRMWA